mmetsp:Transcript_11293/g.26847  ORF Transcript_11293/g.26847 Transcript_11293/m.26847 type:complete len:117 (-) Transcript_11293:439-789(-)
MSLLPFIDVTSGKSTHLFIPLRVQLAVDMQVEELTRRERNQKALWYMVYKNGQKSKLFKWGLLMETGTTMYKRIDIKASSRKMATKGEKRTLILEQERLRDRRFCSVVVRFFDLLC